MLPKHKIIAFASSALCAVCATVQAQTALPSPYSSVDGGVVVSNFYTMSAPSSSQDIFLNALLWATDNMTSTESEAPGPATCDVDGRSLSINCVIASKKLEVNYVFTLSAKVSDNILTVLASDIGCEGEVAVVKLTKRLSFNKFQPEKKEKHKEYMDDFAALYKKLLDDMTTFIASHEPPTVTHWNQVRENEVVKGMTEDECLLAIGRPVKRQEQGSKTQWIYGSFSFVYFENGRVVSLIR